MSSANATRPKRNHSQALKKVPLKASSSRVFDPNETWIPPRTIEKMRGGKKKTELFTRVQSSSFATSLAIIERISVNGISFRSIQENRELLVSTPFGAFVFLSDVLIQTHV